jgi:hypothetical protein
MKTKEPLSFKSSSLRGRILLKKEFKMKDLKSKDEVIKYLEDRGYLTIFDKVDFLAKKFDIKLIECYSRKDYLEVFEFIFSKYINKDI